MDDNELLRYARQILMPEIDIEGQLNINNAHVVIIGLGGLGCLVSRYIVGAGVNKVTIIDDDEISISNIPRQVLFDETHLGEYKVDVAEKTLKRVNSQVVIKSFKEKINTESLDEIQDADILIDCTDNFSARKIINAFSLKNKIPYIYGAANRFEGAVTLFNPNDSQSPCLLCWQSEQIDEDNCQQTGVLAPIVGVIASMQATQCLKFIGKFGHHSFGKVNFYDGFYDEWQTVKIDKKIDCDCQP